MIQRNVCVAVRDILRLELGDPAQQDSMELEVMETFVGFGAAACQLAIRDLHLQLQNVISHTHKHTHVWLLYSLIYFTCHQSERGLAGNAVTSSLEMATSESSASFGTSMWTSL